MPVQIIPEGSSAVVTEKDRRHKGDDRDIVQNTYVTDDRGRRNECNLDSQILSGVSDVMSSVKDAQADLERSSGLHYAGTLGAVKDAQADLERSSGLHYAATMGAVKDAQADLERSSGLHYAGTLDAVKTAQADLERSTGLHYADTVKTIKDSEVGLERSGSSRYAHVVETIKDVESDLERSDALTRDTVRQTEIAVEKSKASIIDVLRDLEFEGCKGFDGVKEEVNSARKELLVNQITGFKDNLIEFKNTQNLMHQLAAQAERTASQNQTQTLLQFKDQVLISERLAAQAARELAECCCEMRQLVASDGQKTRELINLQEVDRLRERAQKAEQQIALFNLQLGKV